MADWIKMRIDVRDDAEVFALAERLKIDRYSVVGRLHAFWSWWDQKSRNGRVDGGVTLACDEVAGMAGFGDAMIAVGWLEKDAQGLFIPDWNKHNGPTAKERAQGNQRQSAYRSRNATGNARVTPTSRKSDGKGVTRSRSSSSNKHSTVTTGTSTAQPPQTPVEETPRSTPPLATTATVPTPRGTFPVGGVEAFAQAHGVKVRKRSAPASFEDPQP